MFSIFTPNPDAPCEEEVVRICMKLAIIGLTLPILYLEPVWGVIALTAELGTIMFIDAEIREDIASQRMKNS